MITLMESRDLDEMIPGNNIDRIYGSDLNECEWQDDGIYYHAEYLGAVVVS